MVYEAVTGNLGSLEANTTLATQELDFNTTTMTFRLEDSQTSTAIVAPIINVSLALYMCNYVSVTYMFFV